MILRALLVLALPAIVGAQVSRMDSAFADVRPDGNGLAALRITIRFGFTGQRASDALKAIADQAQLNLTFDPQLPELRTILTIGARERSASIALLEVARESRLRVRVSREGQLIVTALPVVVVTVPVAAPQPIALDTTPAVTLSAVRTNAERLERLDFQLKTGVGKVSLTPTEVRAGPVFVEPDVLRAVQTLPGIASRNDYTAGFNVRGGEADQNLVLIDGYPIFSPFHLFGLFSTFIDPAVGRVSMHTGALPARFGGRLSSVLSVESANATTSEMHGTAEVSLVSSNASVGRTFRDGEGSWMIAARRTYADVVLNRFVVDGMPYHFGDMQGHIETPIGGGVRLSATAYSGVDQVVPERRDEPEFTFGKWGNRVVGATLSKTFAAGVPGADSLALVQRVSNTRYEMSLEEPQALLHVANKVTDARTGGSVTLYRARWTHEIGYELSSNQTSYFAKGPPGEGLGELIPYDSLDQRSSSASAYGDALWRPSSSLLLEGGVRVDALDGGRGSIVLPRLSLKYFLTPNMAFIAATGRYAQWLHSLAREQELVQPFQFWVSTASAPSVLRDAVVGVERWLSPSRVFKVEAFHKRYERLLVPTADHVSDVTGDEFASQNGSSYGADVLLRQLDGGPFSGWLAYTYSVSSRENAEGKVFFATQDRRHNLNLVGSWRAGPYAYGARLHVASGAPYTPIIGAFGRVLYDPTTKRWTRDPIDPNTQDIPGAVNSERMPFYSRLDVSVRRNGHFRGATFAPYLSVANLLNSKNPAGYIINYTGKPERTSVPNLPFAPTFGVSIGY